MSKRTAVLLVILLVAVLAVSAGGCSSSSTTTTTVASTGTTTAATTGTTTAAPTGEPIVFGAVVSATGPNAPLGQPERQVLIMMEKSINAAGGIDGRPLKIVIEDDKSTPADAVTATQKLINQDKAIAIIGGTGSASTLAMKPITAKAGIPQIAMAAANAITDLPPVDWIWRTPPKDAIAAEKAVNYVANDLKAKNIAVLYDSNAFGSSGYKEIVKLAPKYGLTIVDSESYKTDDTDLTAQLTKINGKKPDAVIVWGTNPGPAIAAKNMKQLGMTMPYVGSHGIANQTFIKLAGPAAEGVVFPAGKLAVPSSITDPKQKEVVDKFIADYQAATGGQNPNTFAGHAFDSVSLLENAIKVAKGTDPAALQKALNETTGFVGPDGIYNYSNVNHDGLAASDMIVVKIENGKWVLAAN
jgi:branched-chain amino acid transport system substrate-binding protein